MGTLTHGQWGTRVYWVWAAMVRRCYKTYDKGFPGYGGRGIRVCAEWRQSFSAFVNDMGRGKKGWTLERVNNDGDYELSNCVWATRAHQQRNRRNNRVFEVRGIKGCFTDLLTQFGVKSSTVRHRLSIGWTPERAFTEAADQRFNHHA